MVNAERMKKTIQNYFLFAVCSLGLTAEAKTFTSSWSKSPFEQKVFIENKGQFDGLAENKPDKVLFGASSSGLSLYFTPTGLSYVNYEMVPMSEKEREKLEKRRDEKEKEEGEVKMKGAAHFLSVEWIGSNPNVQIVSEDPVSFYYTYRNGMKANACKKIIYRNLYTNIDLEYVFPADTSGIK